MTARPPRIACTATLDIGSWPLGFKVAVGVAVEGNVVDDAMGMLLAVEEGIRVVVVVVVVIVVVMLSLKPMDGKTLLVEGNWSACRLMILGEGPCFREPR